jgi:hypothetical protein
VKLAPTGKRSQAVNPFKSILEHADPNFPPQTGAGIGVDRAYPGIGRASASRKRRRWDAETLGATPPRDGPFARSAEPIARMFPPRMRADPRQKQTGVDPFGGIDAARRAARNKRNQQS